MSSAKGKFIILYGINNLGKSTQALLLVERIKKTGHDAVYIKYPLYELEPSGPILNEYLRKNNPYQLSSREAQMFYALNRTQFEPTLKKYIETGVHVVAEDYTGTGMAWGIGKDVDGAFMARINCHLLKEDVAFLFNGKRFTKAKEAGHLHESNDTLMERVRLVHLDLAKEFGWNLIDANASEGSIHEKIWQAVKPLMEGM